MDWGKLIDGLILVLEFLMKVAPDLLKSRLAAHQGMVELVAKINAEAGKPSETALAEAEAEKNARGGS